MFFFLIIITHVILSFKVTLIHFPILAAVPLNKLNRKPIWIVILRMLEQFELENMKKTIMACTHSRSLFISTLVKCSLIIYWYSFFSGSVFWNWHQPEKGFLRRSILRIIQITAPLPPRIPQKILQHSPIVKWWMGWQFAEPCQLVSGEGMECKCTAFASQSAINFKLSTQCSMLKILAPIQVHRHYSLIVDFPTAFSSRRSCTAYSTVYRAIIYIIIIIIFLIAAQKPSTKSSAQ